MSSQPTVIMTRTELDRLESRGNTWNIRGLKYDNPSVIVLSKWDYLDRSVIRRKYRDALSIRRLTCGNWMVVFEV